MTEVPLLNHPRPQLRREGIVVLDGEWQFADDVEAQWRRPEQVRWNGTIRVPYAPETPASGVGTAGYRKACWYRTERTLGEPVAGGRLMLHFGAVDHRATVWVDGARVGEHEGGYTPFSVDVTDFADGGAHRIEVRAEDDPLDLAKPRGKQDWELEAHAIWYPRTSGIWQTVWLEQLPAVSVQRLHWTADLDRCALRLTAGLAGDIPAGARVRVRLSHEGRILIDDTSVITGAELERDYVLDTTGLHREKLMWHPDRPALIDAVVEVLAADGDVVDAVRSYAGLREVGIRAGRFCLNGAPLTLRMALDQGYWAQSGLSAPDETALRHDVELAKAMGFNGVRKHQKIEDPRYLYWADKLGLMVWEELPGAYTGGTTAMRRAVREWADVIERDRSHPCIVTWVPFNESWGLHNLAGRQDTRDYAAGVARLTRALDPTRPVVTNDGWENLGGDIVGVHDYEPDPEVVRARYDAGRLDAALAGFGKAGRLLTVGGGPDAPAGEIGERAVLITECGGLGLRAVVESDSGADGHAKNSADNWSYSHVRDGADLVAKYAALVHAVTASNRVSGFCWTQFADTYQEVNGLLYENRAPKAPLELIARATRGLPLSAAPNPVAEVPAPRKARRQAAPAAERGRKA